MKIVTKTLEKTLYGDEGKLYSISDGRRVLFANCRPVVEIYEHSYPVDILGKRNGQVKTRLVGIAISSDSEFTRSIDDDFLRSVSRFELTTRFQREDGTFERIKFDNLTPVNIWLTDSDDWQLEVVGQDDVIKKLLAF